VEDLSVQLSALGSFEVLAFVLQGKRELSTAELLACFTMPSASADEEHDAKFATVGSPVAAWLEALLRDETFFTSERRFAMLRWCTALSVLPADGLRDHTIRLRLYGMEADDHFLPETHTCTRELHLPNYSSADVLRAKLATALEHIDDGFYKE
jgi:hypothetical protein